MKNWTCNLFGVYPYLFHLLPTTRPEKGVKTLSKLRLLSAECEQISVDSFSKPSSSCALVRCLERAGQIKSVLQTMFFLCGLAGNLINCGNVVGGVSQLSVALQSIPEERRFVLSLSAFLSVLPPPNIQIIFGFTHFTKREEEEKIFATLK